jgi:hypothetical protein
LLSRVHTFCDVVDGDKQLLSKFVQASIDQGKIPDDWKEALVTPLFKTGDKSTPSNYRPVSLTSIAYHVKLTIYIYKSKF